MEQRIEELKDQLKVLNTFCRTLTEILCVASLESREQAICDQIRSVTGTQDVALFLRKFGSNYYQYRVGAGKQTNGYEGAVLEISAEHCPRQFAFADKIATKGSIGFRKKEKEIEDVRHRYSTIFPVTLSDEVKGLVVCMDDNPFELQDSVVNSQLPLLVAQCGSFIECYEETSRLEEKAKSLSLLYEIGGRLSAIRDEDKLLDSILELVEEHIQVDRCSLMILDEDKKVLRIKRAFGMPEVDIETVNVVLGEGIAGHVATGTKPLLIKDISAEKHLISQIDDREKFRTNSLLSVPLVTQGKTIGVINVNNRKDGWPFSLEDRDLLVKIASEIAAVLQRSYMALQVKKAKELEADIRHLMA